MPGRKPADAVRAYIEPLQQSLSCLTKCVIRPSGYDIGKILVLTFSEPTAPLRTRKQEVLHLSFVQQFSIQPAFTGYKIRTHSYEYSIENDGRHEILAFHWHPNSKIDFPHMHLGTGAAESLREELFDIHLPSDRIAFEDVAFLLLDGFQVEPERPDARDVLRANLALFQKHKTWPISPSR